MNKMIVFSPSNVALHPMSSCCGKCYKFWNTIFENEYWRPRNTCSNHFLSLWGGGNKDSPNWLVCSSLELLGFTQPFNQYESTYLFFILWRWETLQAKPADLAAVVQMMRAKNACRLLVCSFCHRLEWLALADPLSCGILAYGATGMEMKTDHPVPWEDSNCKTPVFCQLWR